MFRNSVRPELRRRAFIFDKLTTNGLLPNDLEITLDLCQRLVFFQDVIGEIDIAADALYLVKVL